MPIVGEQLMPIVRIKQHFQITLPAELRQQLQLEEGGVMEATLQENAILLKPKALVDREHVEVALAEGLLDYAEGRVDGPFKSAEEWKASLKHA